MPEVAHPVDITVKLITDRGKYSSIKSGDIYYNVWDKMVLDRLVLGQSYTVMVTSKTSIDPNTQQAKTFNNIVGLSANGFNDIEAELEAVMPGTKAANKVISPAVSPPVRTAAMPATDHMIDVRKTALLAVTPLLAAGVITQKNVDKYLHEYERYILSGLPVEQKTSTANSDALDLNDFVA